MIHVHSPRFSIPVLCLSSIVSVLSGDKLFVQPKSLAILRGFYSSPSSLYLLVIHHIPYTRQDQEVVAAVTPAYVKPSKVHVQRAGPVGIAPSEPQA